ncbi:hypothetical protein WJX72_004669 [[Myrmecia] bisecta]|uniref:Alpha-ketoglutarate-dependent dioxygenase AlkB-like domain-containing protein n=1 Tax=[Myrmecia] bisecta TaxID=41462 RepID=A0AAW1P6C8_9CHLO
MSDSSSEEDLAAFESVAVTGLHITSTAAKSASKAAGAAVSVAGTRGKAGDNGHAGNYSLDDKDAPLPQGFQDKLWNALERRLEKSLKTTSKKRRLEDEAERPLQNGATEAPAEDQADDMGLRLFGKVKVGTPVVLSAPVAAPKRKKRKKESAQEKEARMSAQLDEEAQALQRLQSVVVEASQLMERAAVAAAKAEPHIADPDAEDEEPKRKTRIYIPAADSAKKVTTHWHGGTEQVEWYLPNGRHTGLTQWHSIFSRDETEAVEKQVDQIFNVSNRSRYMSTTFDDKEHSCGRVKAYFGGRVPYKGPGRTRTPQADVDAVPTFLRELYGQLEERIPAAKGRALQHPALLDIVEINMYRPGGRLGRHVDPIIYKRPIVMVRLFNDGFLSLGYNCGLRRKEAGPFFQVPMMRGSVTMLDGLFADELQHMVKGSDVQNKSATILPRSLHREARNVLYERKRQRQQ